MGQVPCEGEALGTAGCGFDPVYFDRGEFVHETRDLFLPGRGLNLELKRTYRSNSTYHSPFGFGWDMNYNMRIRKMADGSFMFLTGMNRKEPIASDGTGPPGFYDTLTLQGDGTYLLTSKHGGKVFFDANGNATRIEDRFGNFLTLTYDSEGLLPLTGPSQYFVNQTEGVVALDFRLTRVEDSLGRYFDFFYDANGRLDHVTDSAGRTVTYGYASTNDLISITSPPTNQFPDGLTTAFTYDVSHRLETVTDPKGQTYVTNDYDGQGRLMSQTLLGRGATTLVYDTTNHTTQVTDRKGFVTLWTFEDDGRPIQKEEFTQAIHEGDPASFVTLYEYDDNGELKKVTYPRGNLIENTYVIELP
jgi:YD repeat-containing protein